MKVKELVYSILDLAKAATSDDSFWTEEHVIFLCKKYRSFLLKKEKEKQKNSADIASEFEYQEICLDLEKSAAIDGSLCTGGYYLRTVQKIPKILDNTLPRVYPKDFYQGINISYVSRDRMRYVGTNKFLKNILYVSLGPDKHLYLKSSNPQFMYLQGKGKLSMSAIFEDFDEAIELSCNSDEKGGKVENCDILEADFPIREYLVPTLIELVVKALTSAEYKPEDSNNNASDDLADIAAFLRRNLKSSLQREIEL